MSDELMIFPIRDLSGGTNLASNDLIHGQDELGLIVNWNLNKIGSLTKIHGYSSYGNLVNHATNTLGMGNFYYSGGQKHLIALDFGDVPLSPSASASPSESPSPSLASNTAEIFIFDPGTNDWTNQDQALTSGYKVEFCTFLDGVFAVNYADATRYFDGTDWSTSTNVTDAPKAQYVLNYNERVYLANLDVDGTRHNSRVISSSLPDLDDYSITWDVSSTGPFFDVSPLDGDEITGLGKNFNRLLIFKERGLWRYDTNSLYQFPGAPGTNNNRTIQNVNEWTLYFHTTGIFGLKDDAVMKVSRAIQDIIDGVQSINLDKLCSYSVGDHYYLFLHDVINEDKGIDIKNCFVDLDVARMRWTVGSLADTPMVFGTYRNDRSEVTYDAEYEYDNANQTYDGYYLAPDTVYFGDNTGKIYQIDNSYDFDGEVIHSYFETVNYYPAGVQARCELQSLKIYTDKGRRCRFYYSIDGGPWKPIVKYEYRAGEIYYTFESGLIVNHIKLKCIDTSTGDRPGVKGFDFIFSHSYEI